MTRPTPLVLLLVVCAACQTPDRPDPVPPADESAALVAVRIRTRADSNATYPSHISLRGAWFVRVAEGADPTRTTPVLKCNYFAGNVAYLLNAEPGRYAVVAVEDETEGAVRPTYLSAEAILATVTDVGPGERAMIGALFVEQSSLISKSDEAQRFYRNKVYPPDQRSTGVFGYFRGPNEFRSKRFDLDRDEDTLASMRKVMRQQLGKTGW